MKNLPEAVDSEIVIDDKLYYNVSYPTAFSGEKLHIYYISLYKKSEEKTSSHLLFMMLQNGISSGKVKQWMN